MIFYFSGTGNSFWVVKQLADELQERAIDMAKIQDWDRQEYSLAKGEKIGFVFPIHGWRPPQLVRRFVETLNLKTDAVTHYIYVIVTCGDDVGCGVTVMENTLRAKGLHLNAAFSLTMPNTYVCIPFFDVDNPDIRKRKLKNAENRLRQISSSLKNEENVLQVHKGSLPRIKTYVLGSLFERFLVKDCYFHVLGTCEKCGLCIKACPTQNIKMENHALKWEGYCTTCLACYHHCPTHSIRFGKYTDKKGQYTLKRYWKEIEQTH